MVTRAREIQPRTSAITLTKRGPKDSVAATQTYTGYVHPVAIQSGQLDKGAAGAETTIVLYQEGAEYAPAVDDKITDADGNVWNVLKVETRLNFRANYGVHRLTVRRTP
jgi:hypothetical protein